MKKISIRASLDKMLGPIVLAFFIGKNTYDFCDYMHQYDINKSMTAVVEQWIDSDVRAKELFKPQDYTESIATLEGMKRSKRIDMVENIHDSYISMASALFFLTGGISYILRGLRKRIVS